jgi:two-component system NarL family sensor kinase
MAYLKPSLKITGTPITIDKKIETIIFRILQEFFTNTIKHSKATNLDVNLLYKSNTLHVTVKDNGVGFDYHQARAKNGIGLTNIETRTKLIGATVDYKSNVGEGTTLSLTYKPQPL